MLKRLEGTDAEQFQRFIGDENTIIIVDGTPYLVARLPFLNEIGLDIEGDPGLKASIERAKQDIKAGQVFSTEEAIEMLERGEIER